MKLKTLILIPLFALTSACVSMTPYTGSEPDFSAADKNSEVQKFSVQDKYGYFDYVGNVEMGPQKTAYTLDSMKLIIQKVSPEADKKIQKAQKLNFTGMLVAQAGILLLLANQSQDSKLGSMALTGTGIGVMAYSRSVHTEGLETYNQDLRRKFAPGVAWNQSF